MIKLFPLLLLLTLIFSFVGCHKDDPVPKPIVSNITIDLDTILTQNSQFFTTDMTPIESLSITMNITPYGNYSFSLGGVMGTVTENDDHFTACASITEIIANTDGTSGLVSIPFSLVDSKKQVFYSENISLTILPTSKSITITNLSISPSQVVFDGTSYKLTDSSIAGSYTLTFQCAAVDTLDILIKGKTYRTIKKSNHQFTITNPLSDLYFTAGSNNLKLDFTAVKTNGDIAYSNSLTITTQTHYPEPYEQFAWHIAYTPSELTNSYEISPDAHISLYEAWKTTKGKGVRIAVIDDDFTPDHEDLSGNVLLTYNPNTGGSNVNTTPLRTSHGTTCAGFAASPINGKGLIGAAPEASLILIADEYLSDAALIKGFDFAKNNGAKVISCSWGSYNVSQALTEKIAEIHKAGIVTVFACGNDGESLDTEGTNDESELPTVIGVGASDETNDRSYFSNYGSTIEFMAPGGSNILGVLGVDNMGTTGSFNQINLVDNNYAFTLGTSFSAPLVAGVAALVLSVEPSLTPDEVRHILIQSCDRVGGTDADYGEDKFDTYRSFGKINAHKAVKLAQTYR